MKQLTIGKLAELAAISTDTLRYYEKIGLLAAESRTPAGYRLYHPDAGRILRFIRGAQALNFSLEEIRALLKLESSDKATCAEMMKHTEAKISEAEIKIRELKEIKKVLSALVRQCPGDNTPTSSCPILDHIKHKMKLYAAAIIVSTLGMGHATQAQAKPISYVGGVMAMQENDETGHTLSFDYTLDPKYAVGLYAKKERGGKEFETIGPQFNTLIKRWNLPGGQGNIFNMTGAGLSRYHGDNEVSLWTGLLADYETRRVFTSYEARFMYAGDIEKSVWQRARIGVAPYLANYDDISTWFMLQVDHHPAKEETVVVTPLVRFFYKTTLIEAGYSSNDYLMFNWWLQF